MAAAGMLADPARGGGEATAAVEALTRFCATLRFEDLPPSIVLEAKNRVLDFLGCALGGLGEASSRIVAEALGAWGGAPDATVLGSGVRLPAALAAFCNAAAGHAVELDDDHKEAILHPGVCVVPAALAVGERLRAPGRRVLAAVVVGYEVMCRVGEASRPHGLLAKGFHPTGICGAFGAAAAAAHLQGLPLEQFRSALGIAGSFASGLFEFVNDGSLVKRLHPANAARSGVLAAELAERGYTGPKRVLEGRLGFFGAFAGGFDLGPLVRRPGGTFEVARTSYKQYACCSYCHAPMDALRELLRAERVDSSQVQEVVGRTFTEAIHIVGEPLARKHEPANPVDAQFSAPYCLALILRHGRAMPEQFTQAAVEDPGLRELTRRIRLEGDPALDREFPRRYPAEVTVRLKDGRVLTHRVPTSKGDPSWPLTQEEIEEKFAALAGRVLPTERVEAVRDAVGRLESCPDVAELGRLLGKPGSPATG